MKRAFAWFSVVLAFCALIWSAILKNWLMVAFWFGLLYLDWRIAAERWYDR